MSAAPTEPQPSLAAHSAGRFGAELVVAALSLLVGVVTARALGPPGKGTLASLLFLAVLFTRICSLGLGEALTVMVGRGELAVKDTVAVALPGLMVSCLGGTPVLAASAWLLFGAGLSGRALTAAGAGMVLATFGYVLGVLAMASGSIALATAGHLAGHLVTAVAVTTCVVVAGWGIAGAAAGDAIGAGAGAVLLLLFLHRRGCSIRPAWRPRALGRAVRVGVVIELSYVLIALSQRVDQLFVLRLSGAADAGRYSIALTLSQLAAYGAVAISTVSFARIAYAPDGEWQNLVRLVARRSSAASTVAAACLAVALPLVVPTVYGRNFAPAVAPTLLLIPGAVAGGLQWVLCRVLAARQRQRAMLLPIGATILAMVGLDLTLIPHFDTLGAAAASSLATMLGLVVAVQLLRADVRPGELAPRWDDFRSLPVTALALLGLSRPDGRSKGV